jgi:hypothetical protein
MGGQSAPLSERRGVINEAHPWSPRTTIIDQEVPFFRPDVDMADRVAINQDMAREALDAMRRQVAEEDVRPIKASDYSTLQRQARYNALLSINAGQSRDQVLAQLAPTIARMNEMAPQLGMPIYDVEVFYEGVKNGTIKEDAFGNMIAAMSAGAGGGPVRTSPDVEGVLNRLGFKE